MSAVASARPTVLLKMHNAWTMDVSSSPNEEDGSRVDCKMGFEVPPGYLLCRTPRYFGFSRDRPGVHYDEVRCSYGPGQAFIAIAQFFYALSALYAARRHQILRFGYAAFGLTTAPFAVMSLINLVSLLFRPDFDEVYLVGSRVLDECLRRCNTDLSQVKIVADIAEPNPVELDVREYTVTLNGFKTATKAVQAHFTGDKDGEQLAMLEKQSEAGKSSDGVEKDVEWSTERPTSLQGSTSNTSAVHSYLVLTDEDDARFVPGKTCQLTICSNNPCVEAVHPARIAWRKLFGTTGSPPKMAAPTIKDKKHAARWAPDVFATLFIVVVIDTVVLAIVGGLSGFRRGRSTFAQRVWTMCWLVVSLFAAPFGLGLVWVYDFFKTKAKLLAWLVTGFGGFLLAGFCAVPIGGMVVVVQEFRAFGNCISL